MNANSIAPADKRNIWIRGLLMLLMMLILHVAGTVLFIIALIQFVIVLASDAPNARLVAFGRSLAATSGRSSTFWFLPLKRCHSRSTTGR